MAPKSKSRKAKAPKQKGAPKKSPMLTTTRRATILHKLHGDPQRMLKLEWNADRNDFVGTPVSLQEAADIASNAHPPFCKNTLNDPTKKYYCEFSVHDNEYLCTLVDAND